MIWNNLQLVWVTLCSWCKHHRHCKGLENCSQNKCFLNSCRKCKKLTWHSSMVGRTAFSTTTVYRLKFYDGTFSFSFQGAGAHSCEIPGTLCPIFIQAWSPPSCPHITPLFFSQIHFVLLCYLNQSWIHLCALTISNFMHVQRMYIERIPRMIVTD